MLHKSNIYMFDYICVAGPMEGTSVDDSNEVIIPVADDVDKIYPRSPGIRFIFILFS